ncbi:DUF2267 domain-containing protein [Halorientalis salina]|uniref:DUF2267 domain-containing protein n=1 Tax=Halorientalis salina TaxID=2932266 RepID=UPI0010AB72E0|nr:DUF2267 domain-containing protein [Halorientalis salina]
MRTDYDTLVDDIATRAEIDNLAKAERAAIETLLTLGEYVPRSEADALGVFLPGALGDAVTERDESADEPSAEEFVELVAERQGFGVEPADALRHVRAVLATIVSHGGRDEIQRARDGLPDDFDPLFETAELTN